ncbi:MULTISPECIES: hypothetical protein [Paenibacillus]|uniref:hypothetical protein n=1 Tax=Paenibacillus TaxID=44249 RepID=UPI00020D67B6|nr:MULTISPECIES: hypothetical protein [Paenibacillus]EGL20246.1 hypothetical protein HMPREF9413_3651 [Paenibacillus sp. HGF7]EPD92309.1 hypothetical protein HMPREF1207_00979 [Paenibacillus sp. HGH0039]MBV6712680.1 hypothetical protein [Paenibacillus chitinolyticus]
MTLQDALFNWLQIRIVADARPLDEAAGKTADFFEEILREDHGVSEFERTEADEYRLRIDYVRQGEKHSVFFDREQAGRLLADIGSNPKYNE